MANERRVLKTQAGQTILLERRSDGLVEIEFRPPTDSLELTLEEARKLAEMLAKTAGLSLRDPMVRDALSGDIDSAIEALMIAGEALASGEPLESALRRYIGEALIKAGNVAKDEGSGRVKRHMKTEERMIAVGRALGLVRSRSGKPMRQRQESRKLARDLAIAARVLYEVEENNQPLTKGKGAFLATAKALGLSSPRVAEHAYYSASVQSLFRDQPGQKAVLKRLGAARCRAIVQILNPEANW